MTARRSDTWRFQGKAGIETIRVRGPLASDNANTLAEAAIDGLGIVLLGTFVVGDHLRRGRLKEVLPGRLVQDSSSSPSYPNGASCRTRSACSSTIWPSVSARRRGGITIRKEIGESNQVSALGEVVGSAGPCCQIGRAHV